jgi:hypothetical protein
MDVADKERSMYNEQTNAHLIDSLLYSSVFIGLICFNANASSSESSYSLPAKLHKRVNAVLVVFFKKTPPRLHEHVYVS